MLGPIRFTHIESCAREAILQSRKGTNIDNGPVEKRQKLQDEDEAARGVKLQQVLQQRDQSISVLRGLLAEKSNSISKNEKTATTPAKQMEYCKMPLGALVKLEKARDATIGFLLEQISKAEAASASEERPALDIVNGIAIPSSSLEAVDKADLDALIGDLDNGNDDPF